MKPTQAIYNYFKNTISYKKNEIYIAKEIIKNFEIKNSDDLYKFGQYINYKSDNVYDIQQVMQTLDFTLYEGSGDCEDFARAYVVLAKRLNINAYYWLMFKNENLTEGHTTFMYIDEEGYLSVLNYTNYYKYKGIKLTHVDIEKKTEAFQKAFNAIIGAFSLNFDTYYVNWIVKTNDQELPSFFHNMQYNPVYDDVEQKSYLNDRSQILEYINKMNLSRNLVTNDFLLPLAGFVAFSALVKWFI